MLHLQMAANLSTAIGAAPCFTGKAMQSDTHGWTCYGRDRTVIPHIVDLQDTSKYKHVRVNLEELNPNQCDLFLAIEQPEELAREELREFDKKHPGKYFPSVPFEGWTADKKDAADLPLFGTIGYMYECFAHYISIEYSDGQTLWQKLYVNNSVQQDMFNTAVPGHPKAEYPQFATRFGEAENDGGKDSSFNKAIDMMAAITDQGEGSAAGIKRYRRGSLLKAVQPDYREDPEALKMAYPSYTNDGGRAASADAAARSKYAPQDHFERFIELKEMQRQVQTWAHWHAANNRWDEKLLINEQYDPDAAPDNIPTPSDVAGALNRLKEGGDKTWKMLSTVANGALYGITSVLNTYWQEQSTSFPYPSMVGAGDRFSICWAVLGKSPDLTHGVPLPDETKLYHACQGMSVSGNPGASAPSGCAALAIYHTCRGSNGCHAQGGCGFAQLDTGGGSCGHAVAKPKPAAAGASNGCGASGCGGASGAGTLYSAPADNKCKTFGGCAVPISASQLYPASGTMKLYNFGPAPHHPSEALEDTLGFGLGDGVYDIAWQAYGKVMQARGVEPAQKPQPTDLRLALPPST
jgi:hypothetical protein